jgi:hypothetical protein
MPHDHAVGNVKSLGVGARSLLGYFLGRLFTSVQPGKLVSASLLNLGATNAGYRCTKGVTDRCSQKGKSGTVRSFLPPQGPPAIDIFLSVPRFGLADNRLPWCAAPVETQPHTSTICCLPRAASM